MSGNYLNNSISYSSMKWRYQKEKPKRNFDLYVRIPQNKSKAMKIRGWSFNKAPNGSLFKCEVIEEDGKPVDKFWYVWDFDLREALKSKLKGKKNDREIVDITVHKKTENGEEIFTLQ